MNYKTERKTEIQSEVSFLESEEEKHQIILHNDDINTFDFVIDCLVKICDHTPVQAEQCAYIVHYKGKCEVKSGSYQTLEPKCTALLSKGLSAEII